MSCPLLSKDTSIINNVYSIADTSNTLCAITIVPFWCKNFELHNSIARPHEIANKPQKTVNPQFENNCLLALSYLTEPFLLSASYKYAHKWTVL